MQPDPIESFIDDAEPRRLPPLLRRAWYGLNQAFRRRIQHQGITPDQFTVLRTLIEGDPLGLSQRQITEAMSSDPNTVASLLERMESAGWIERRAHERDRRARRIRLLPAGRRKHLAIRKNAQELQDQVLEVLPEAKRDEFLEALSALADACREAADRVPPAAKPKRTWTAALAKPRRRPGKA